MAYETGGNTSISAGVIPEPASSVVIGGLVAGSAAAFAARRRRKNKLAA
jgi:MYXO-CTERM domain-containing protein